MAAWYQAAGYEMLDRNWRCREGELDLVLARDRVVVFCEVKTRSTDTFGAPIEAITHQKRQRVRVLAASGSKSRRRWFGKCASMSPRFAGPATNEPRSKSSKAAF